MQTNLITTTAVTTAYISFSLYVPSQRKNVPCYQAASMSIIRYTKHKELDTQPSMQSVSTKVRKLRAQNTNMFEGQLQVAQSKTLSASTNLKRPETQS